MYPGPNRQPLECIAQVRDRRSSQFDRARSWSKLGPGFGLAQCCRIRAEKVRTRLLGAHPRAIRNATHLRELSHKVCFLKIERAEWKIVAYSPRRGLSRGLDREGEVKDRFNDMTTLRGNKAANITQVSQTSHNHIHINIHVACLNAVTFASGRLL